jgi:hypothetical protein
MNTTYHFFIFFFLALFTISCAKEDSLKPTQIDEDYFTVSPDATDPISVLRRKFHEDHNIHLLFTDTLRHEQRGIYADGTPFWFTETIDLNYIIPVNTQEDYRLTYLETQTNREKSVEFVETYILPHLGGSLIPYSILLLQQLYTYDDYYDELEQLDYCNSFRSLAVSTGEIIEMADEEKAAFCTPMFKDIIKNKLTASMLEPFYTFCEEFYGEYFEDLAKEGKLPSDMDPKNMTLENVRTLGFLREAYSGAKYFRSNDYDRDDYINVIFNLSESEFMEQYDNYPVIIQKYNILKQIITDLGFKF